MPAETDKKRNHVIHTGTVIRNYHATIFPTVFYIWIFEFHKNLFRLKNQHTALICSHGLDNNVKSSYYS